MIWFLVITNIIGWALAISSLTLTGLIVLTQNFDVQKQNNTQRQTMTPKVKLFNFEDHKE